MKNKMKKSNLNAFHPFAIHAEGWN